MLLRVRRHFKKGTPAPRPMRFRGNDRVLVLAAHPDDETIGCAGTILAHLEAGDQVSIFMVTDGSGSRAGGLTPTEMAARRHEEVQRVARIFRGARITELALAENAWDDGQLAGPLKSHLAQSIPGIIYAPSCVDFHPEHIKVARVLAHVLAEGYSGQVPLIRVYEMQVPLGVELVNLVSGLAHSYRSKVRAIAVYATQRGALNLWRRQARYVGLLYGLPGGGEAFWEITPAAYVAVNDQAGWGWQDTPFRSLSGRPFGDYLAHVRGAKTRVALRETSEMGHAPLQLE